jgi:hypothetical protein
MFKFRADLAHFASGFLENEDVAVMHFEVHRYLLSTIDVFSTLGVRSRLTATRVGCGSAPTIYSAYPRHNEDLQVNVTRFEALKSGIAAPGGHHLPGSLKRITNPQFRN